MIRSINFLISQKSSVWLWLVLLILQAIVTSRADSEEITVDILSGQIRAIPISISLGNKPDGPHNQSIRQKIEEIITRNLAWSGIFSIDDPLAFPEERNDIVIQPDFERWKALNTQVLATGNVSVTAPDSGGISRIKVVVRLWNVVTQELLLNKTYSTDINNYRRLSHIVSDDIFERISGERGYFDSRIVFVHEQGPRDKRKRRLAIMDQDGENISFLTSGDYESLAPRFSPNRQKIAYMRLENDSINSYIIDISSGQQEKIESPAVMSFAQRFGHNDSYILLSLAQDSNTDIYRFDIASKSRYRLTSHSGIDVSPSASPDGTRIVFNSDRSGVPQLYTMKYDGSDKKRISFGGGRYSTPVWSPRGDLIAFTKQERGVFYIGVMNTDGSQERLLSQAYLAESPAWAPNGQRIIFYRQMQQHIDNLQLYSIDILGLHGRAIITPGNASDPSWSPHLPRK